MAEHEMMGLNRDVAKLPLQFANLLIINKNATETEKTCKSLLYYSINYKYL
jgi:hypothetical protein